MSKGFTLQWNGAAILAKTRTAQAAAVAEVTTLAAAAAAADTPVDTGRAQRSVQAQPAQSQDNRTGASWGSFGVPYYIFLELRGNMLRNAADQHYPQLATALKNQLQGVGQGVLQGAKQGAKQGNTASQTSDLPRSSPAVSPQFPSSSPSP